MNIKFVLLLLACCCLLSCRTTDYPEHIVQAESYYKQKNFQKSYKAYATAFKLKETDSFDLYHGACSAALIGNHVDAFKWLNLSIENGWDNFSQLYEESDLSALRDDPRWTAMLNVIQIKAAKMEAQYNQPLKKVLDSIYQMDQHIRIEYLQADKSHSTDKKSIDSIISVMNTVDQSNVLVVCEILDEYGWLGKEVIGKTANAALFLVIQHANLNIQQKYLPMMRVAVANKNAEASSLALLEDRVALATGDMQTYGSQIGFDNKTKKYYILPLKNPDLVDERRASVGLGDLKSYVAQWNIMQDVSLVKQKLK